MRCWGGFTVVLVGSIALAIGGASVAAGSSSKPTPTTARAPSTKTVARYRGYTSAVYSDKTHWVCRPDMRDICDSGLDASVVRADGTLTKQRWKRAKNSPIDCFYVYPTISRDRGANSDLVPSPTEEAFVTLNQVARLGQDCRVFAPVYRQVTLTSLTTALAGGSGFSPDAAKIAFGDVLDAWKYYMAHDNHGRGVVLVGHSQGSGMLTSLIKQEIDPLPDVRSHLVAAYLGGTGLRVPAGADVGGDFAHVALCRTAKQTGCAIAWASFRSTAPPPANSLFGKPRSGTGAVACVNPAALSGGDATLHAYFPANPKASILAALGTSTSQQAWLDPSRGTVTTPFVTLPGLLSGECVSSGGFNYLSITVHGDPSDPRADDIGGDVTPEWGLHLDDMNLVQGDMVSLVRRQSAAYLAPRKPAR